MAIVIKSKSFLLFKKIGVPEELLSIMEAAGVKLSLGWKAFALLGPDGQVLEECALPVSSNELIKGLCSDSMTMASKSLVVEAIKKAMVKLGASEVTLATTVVKAPKEAPSPKDMLLETTLTQPKSSPEAVYMALHTSKKEVAPVDAVIPLRDAKAMYQRVKGTSGGSVYVVVAMNSSMAVAARIHGDSISMRVEGNPSTADKNRLVSQTFTEKVSDKGSGAAYMSAHFTCNKVPVERVLGAVLVGSGIKFDTPIPDPKKVREFCK